LLFFLSAFALFYILSVVECGRVYDIESRIPGKYIVELSDLWYDSELSPNESLYYSNLELELFDDNSFSVNQQIDSIGCTSGTWGYEGTKHHRQWYLQYQPNFRARARIGVCTDTGQFFSYQMQSLDDKGWIRYLKFKKVENYW
jgi:hypothetical protein